MRSVNLFISLTIALSSICAVAKQSKEIKTFTQDEAVWTTDEKSGISTATQWGDPKTGPSSGLVKFPKGWTAPLHHHTADHVIGLFSGTLTVSNETGKEFRLTAGSTGTIPGKVKHSTKCSDAADCVGFTYISGKDDMVPAQKTAATTTETTTQ